MTQRHEYSVLGGLNRAKVGHSIGMIAALVSSLLVTSLLAIIDIVKTFGIVQIPNIVIWPISAGVVYGVLYLLFDRYIWKWSRISSFLKVPDLNGTWDCTGQTINFDKSLGYCWSAEIVIVQSWDRIRVRLRGDKSGSNSLAAALLYDETDGFRLMYSYVNDPIMSEKELVNHRGYCELVFDENLQSAKGEYFTGPGRSTFGTMRLVKKV